MPGGALNGTGCELLNVISCGRLACDNHTLEEGITVLAGELIPKEYFGSIILAVVTLTGWAVLEEIIESVLAAY